MCYYDDLAEHLHGLDIASYEAKGFKLIENDYERKEYQREFSGKLTAERRKVLDRYCSRYSGSTRCGCEWDCCGCLHRQKLSYSYQYGQVVISLIRWFNY